MLSSECIFIILNLKIYMEEEVNLSAIHKAELMDEEYPEKNDLFEQFLLDHADENEMEIE